MPLELTVTAGSDAFLHEPDEWLPGQVVNIQEAEDRGFGPGLKWIIELDEDEAGDETWAFCSQSLSPRSKLYGWLKALGADLDNGAVVDLEQYVGKRVDVMFERYQGTAADGSDVEKEKVVKIRASKTKAPKKTQPKANFPDDEAPF